MSKRMADKERLGRTDKKRNVLFENDSCTQEEQKGDPFLQKKDPSQQFLQVIHSVQERVRTSDRMPDREEIAGYFKEMELSPKHQEMVYQYLEHLREEDENQLVEKQNLKEQNPEDIKMNTDEPNAKVRLPDTAFFRLYLEDIRKRKRYSKEEEEILYHRLVTGDTTVIQKLSEEWTYKVLQIAQFQVRAADTKEFADMLQEGNMAVFLALQQLAGSEKEKDFNLELTNVAKDAMEQYLQKTAADADMDQSILAKAALVYEARKFMTEKLQRIPSIAELSQYTKMSETELEDILIILDEKK